MKWITSIPFVLSANLHGGSLVANYPFDDNIQNKEKVYSKSPDDAIFVQLAKTYSQNHKTMHLGKPCDGQSALLGEKFADGITNGAMWYSVPGGMQDWNYLNSNCFEITLEVGCKKFPWARELEQHWDDNKDALLAFINQVHVGVNGFIKDDHNIPVENATIHVEGIDKDISSAKNGDYWRLLTPGNYTISVRVPGFPKATKQVIVLAGPAIQVNFTLALKYSSWSKNQDFEIAENLVDDHYLTNSEIHSAIRTLAMDNPDVAMPMANYGPNSRLALRFIEITSKVNKEASNKPHIALIGGLYGDQPVGRELLMRLARHLIKGYQLKDPRTVKILDNTIVHIIPNVDDLGYLKSFPGACVPTSGNTSLANKFSERFNGIFGPVEALKNNLKSYNYSVLLSLESGGLAINYPSSTKAQKLTGIETAGMQFVGSVYTHSHRLLAKGTQCPNKTDDSNEFINYAFSNYGSLAIAAKVSCCAYPTPDKLPQLWMENLESLLQFIESTHQGVSGIVTDKAGIPIPGVVITLDGRNTPVPVNPSTGSFQLTLAEGFYTFHFSQMGYEKASRPAMVTQEQHMELDVQLERSNQSTGYYSYSQLVNKLHTLRDRFPGITRLYSIGKSRNGRDLFALEISSKPNSGVYPKVVFTAGLHSNELVTVDLLLNLADDLLSNYNRDRIINKIITSTSIHIAPLLNPDGLDLNIAPLPSCNDSQGYLNSRKVDLDTSFYDSLNDIEQPETSAIKEWLGSSHFTLGANLMAGTPDIVVPYQDHMRTLTILDGAIFKYLTQKANVFNSISMCPKANSNLKYNGSFMDYSFHSEDVSMLTIHVDCCMRPQSNQLELLWHTYKPALYQLIEQVQQGVHGVVTDPHDIPITGAMIHIEGSKRTAYSRSNGFYNHLVTDGKYVVMVEAPGYESATKLVQVHSGISSRVEFVLEYKTTIVGVPRSYLVIVTGSLILTIMVASLCIYSLLIKKRQRKFSFHRFDGNLFDDDDDEREESVLFSKKSLLNKKEYHDESSSEEDDVYRSYKWPPNGK